MEGLRSRGQIKVRWRDESTTRRRHIAVAVAESPLQHLVVIRDGRPNALLWVPDVVCGAVTNHVRSEVAVSLIAYAFQAYCQVLFPSTPWARPSAARAGARVRQALLVDRYPLDHD
jgi:hypothetical protein